jgi:hypothetical protein
MLIQTEPSNLGYLLIDHTASTELPAGINERLMERATYTCTHCQAVVVINPDRKRERYKCRGCAHLICDGCAALRTAGAPCRTYAQQLDELFEIESRAQAERQAEAIPSILPTT